jgi:hypothetical protein
VRGVDGGWELTFGATGADGDECFGFGHGISPLRAVLLFGCGDIQYIC